MTDSQPIVNWDAVAKEIKLKALDVRKKEYEAAKRARKNQK